MKKVLVGMSGGVDSSVAVAILQEQGYEVIGGTMIQKSPLLKVKSGESACFLGDKDKDFEDAKSVAKKLGIRHCFVDVVAEYSKEVLDYFNTEYSAGRTPNPCVICNKKIKFGALLYEAQKSNIEFDYFATGHYANVHFSNELNRYLLKKAKYREKDQSYFLAMLNQEQLSKIVFPLGDLTKQEVRKRAHLLDLIVADKKESQDFYSGDYTDLLQTKPQEGIVRLTSGEIIGRHKGISYYTIGQRRGLGIAYNKPIYVVQIDAQNNEVIVGEDSDLYHNSLIANNVNWILKQPSNPFKATTKIRYRHHGAPSTVTLLTNGEVKIDFDTPQRAITPGQFAVFYDDETVIGGGVIKEIL